MKKILLLIVATIVGCSIPHREAKKPFVVVYKNITYEKGIGHYTYQDANGETFDFSDTPTAYKIGDTIK